MKIDYSKFKYESEERKFMMNEIEILLKKHSTHIPLLIQLKSNVLKIEKHKFLVSNDINFNDFITNTLRKKIINLSKDDTIIINVIQYDVNGNEIILNFNLGFNTNKEIKEIYEKYKDTETNSLILRISRNTTYKMLKKYITKITGI